MINETTNTKPEIRETEIWARAAARHERNGQPVAALIARHLAYEVQQARDEYVEIAALAAIQTKAAREKAGLL